VHDVRKHYGVVTDRYKLVHFYGNDLDYWELFDREKDPAELTNYYQNSEYSEQREQLHQELKRLRSELKVPDTDPPASLTVQKR
jgi:arylsulfatase A-like enzyme